MYTTSRNCFLLAEKMEELVRKAVDAVRAAGLDPRVVICDQGATNRSMADRMGITEEAPFFMHNSSRIYFMFDPPHLLKSLRNNLSKYDFTVNNQAVSWKYVVELYKRDQLEKIKLVPKLSDAHVFLPAFSKMKVKLATQVFSHSVACGINLLSSIGKLPPEAVHTAQFIEKINNMFDACNCSFGGTIALRRKMTKSSDHCRVLQQSRDLLRATQVLCPPGTKIFCIRGWLISISALLLIWADLKDSVSFLLTRRLNQDRLENFFGAIRRGLGNSQNPMCQKFRFAFRNFLVADLLKPTGTNCELDLDDFLACLQVWVSKRATRQDRPHPPAKSFLITADRSLLPGIPLSHGLGYVAGYFARRIASRFKCDQLQSVLIDNSPSRSDPNYRFIALKDFSGRIGNGFGGLIVPSDSFYQIIIEAEKVFSENVNECLHRRNVRYLLSEIISSAVEASSLTNHDAFCSCGNVWPYFKNLFVSTRIRWEVKEQNSRKRKTEETGKPNSKLRKLCE